ncbi:23S rRNA (uridine(2552)-2'-O)-methyltransferase [Methanonatronarchaeum sp. AMET-Sl]|uniref:RlmE family RNA methyltransferase n=1 Tax=Methanonatronarchaeum sp. AMET-Sl TaxID=3037654 RepID=UPI00244E009C|nr:23S rRNA (uridine(2552)-2'-O)-methyltransferase [Methanonatronarchaeum sp. AMET-Sl]WGI17082.1 23S rRNA (uridine(2552)-2'-O)-methyltransferase [Methanonatronarchaeum sp. AMET-Sl]
MKDRDRYWRKAKKEGYRARSAYKLKQINDRFDLIQGNDSVVDLGAAPGGWLQVARELSDGEIVGVDLNRIKEIDGVETIVGDITDESTLDEVRDLIGEPDVVLCDASPDLSGNWSIDHSRSIDLARSALNFAKDILRPRGNFLVKVFQGDMYDDFYKEIDMEFSFVKAHSPDASRDQSAEIYIVGKNFISIPVEVDMELKVEIVDIGNQGDGIAKIEDFVIFVPNTELGDEVKIKINEVGERYAKSEVIK